MIARFNVSEPITDFPSPSSVSVSNKGGSVKVAVQSVSGPFQFLCFGLGGHGGRVGELLVRWMNGLGLGR